MNLKSILKKYIPENVLKYLFYIKYYGQRLPEYLIYQNYVKGKIGVEIGGPSTIFKTILPIYHVIENLDGVNYSNQTLWEQKISMGKTFNFYKNKIGIQYINDATELCSLNSEYYDFILSSNCLEHVANPMKAIEEWKRVLKPSGVMVLVLPKKENNFDHKRNDTSFDHLLLDYRNDIKENDLTHIDEILKLHDLEMDPKAGDFNAFKNRSLDNFNNRALHHHVFSKDLISKVLDYFDLNIINMSENKNDYFVLATKDQRKFDTNMKYQFDQLK
jgi:SAM-dependent methyltransferase